MSDRLAEIEARLEAATPGPWEADEWQEEGPTVYAWRKGTGASVLFEADWGTYTDAALIAHATTDLRDLLAVAKAAKGVLASLAGVPMRHQPLGSTRCCNTCGAVWPCEVDRLRAALANLEGGAT